MHLPKRHACALAAFGAALLCSFGPASAQDAGAASRQLLMQGRFATVAEQRGVPNGNAAPAGVFDQGLAAYALSNYEDAASLFAQAAQSDGDPELLIRAAVAATLSLSRAGNNAAACEYARVVQPLVVNMPLLWRGWLEESRRASNCG